MIKIINPKDDKNDRVDKIFEFIKDKQFYCALAYAKVSKLREDEYNKVNNTKDDYFNKLYTLLAYAFDDPWYGYEKVYESFNFKNKKIEDKDFSSFFTSSEDRYFVYLLFLSIAIRALYSKKSGDLDLQERLPKDNGCYDTKIKNVIEELLKNVIEDIEDFKKETGKPLASFVDKKQNFKNRKDNINNVSNYKNNLENFRKKFLVCDTPLESEIRADIFGDNGIVYSFYKQSIKTKNTDILWEDEYQEKFLDDELNVDFSKVEELIEERYKKISKNNKKSKNSEEYNKISDDLFKFLTDIVSFLNKCEADDSSNACIDKADKKYSDESDDYVRHLTEAIEKLNEKKLDNSDNGYVIGISVLEYLLESIKDSISINIEEDDYKYEYGEYFYIPFLLSNQVMLNDLFLPDFPDFYEKEKKIENTFVNSIKPENRIILHANELKDFNYINVVNFKQELRFRQNINNKYNYYSKYLIAKYDKSTPNENVRDKDKASERALNKLYDFQGELELALWYRQLEEKLQIKDELDKQSEYNAYKLYLNIRNNTEKFYNILCTKSNYDFFHKIVDAYLGYIKEKINNLKQNCLEEFKIRNDEKDSSQKEKAFFEEFYGIVNNKIKDYNPTFEDILQYFSDEYREDKYKEVRDFFEGFYNIVFRQKNFSNFSIFLKNFEKSNWKKFTLDNLDDYLYKFMDDQIYNDCLNSAEIYDDETSLESKVVLGGECLNKESAKKLAKDWDNIFLTSQNKVDENLLKSILGNLGFDLNEIKRGTNISFVSNDEKQVIVNNFFVKLLTKKFKHPIAAFGSDAIDKNFKVVCIDRNKINDNTVDYLVNFIENLGTEYHTIILFDYALTLQDRRTLAKKIKTKVNSNGGKNILFLVVDRVAMSFLMKRYNPSKINDMFLSILSPFGFYQPYKSSMGFGASEKNSLDEMFIGRKDELEKIKNISEASINIVYGGRQLGKSSLLQKAAGDINAKNDSNRAVYIYLTRNDKTSKDSSKTYYIKVLDTIVSKMKEAKVFDNDVKINNWEDFGKELTNSLKSDEKDISSLVLLIDEADDFFEICDKDNNDIPFDTFSQISKNVADFEKKKKFKVVFAGLNMIKDYKFLNEGNHFGGQLDSDKTKNGKYYIPIVPFNDKEARELIEKPLRYLGLYFSQDSESLIYLILDKTNYYPCLIQLYCEKLLKEMCKEDYAHYTEENDPVYYVNKTHIKKVLSDKGFLETVKQKFEITLDLSPTDSKADHTYRYLAVILAYLCHNREEGYGSYNVDDFVNVAKEYEIKHICELNEQKNEKEKCDNGEDRKEKVRSKLELYMDHLVELSVFSCEVEKEVKKYGFRRLPLFQLMGSKKEIDDAIASFSSEAN